MPSRHYPRPNSTSRKANDDKNDGDSKSSNIVQETFAAFTSDKGDVMTLRSVLGSDNASRISQAMGEESFKKLESVLDKLLANRRAITLVSAFIDVALIIAGFKVFQSLNSS